MRYFRIAERNFNKKQILKMNFLGCSKYLRFGGFAYVQIRLPYKNDNYIDTPETKRLASMLLGSGWEEL